MCVLNFECLINIYSMRLINRNYKNHCDSIPKIYLLVSDEAVF